MGPFLTQNTAIIKLLSLTQAVKGSSTNKTPFLGLAIITPQLLNFHQLGNIHYQIFKIPKSEASDNLFVRPLLIDAKVILQKCSSGARKLYFTQLIWILHDSKRILKNKFCNKIEYQVNFNEIFLKITFF